MTRTEIEARFKGMMLDYTHIGNRENSIKHGYWSVPVEKYKFKVVVGPDRAAWQIRIESTDTSMTYSAEDGIQWIQDLIRDKMEENADKIIYGSMHAAFFFAVHIRRAFREQNRLIEQLFTNPSYKKAKCREK